MHSQIVDYFAESLSVRKDGNDCVVVLPIIGRDHDLVELYAKYDESRELLILSDEAETIADLVLHGTDVRMGHGRTTVLSSVRKAYGLEIANNEIFLKVPLNRAGKAVFDLASAMLALQYLQYTSRPTKIRAFRQYVQVYLEELNPHFQKDPKFPGASGEKHGFDFGYAERDIVIEALSAPSSYAAREKAMNLCMRAIEVRQVDPKIEVFAFYDDAEPDVEPVWSTRELHLLEKYTQHVVAWTKKDEYRDILA